jgi:PhoH-like ATPase
MNAGKIFIVDETPTKIDPHAHLTLSTGGNVVVIPIGIIDRISLQPSGSKTLDILENLGSTGDLNKGISTPSGGVIILDSKSRAPEGPFRQAADDKMILETARRWMEYLRRKKVRPGGKNQEDRLEQSAQSVFRNFPASQVCIVTKRPELRLKAAAESINAEDYRHGKVVASVNEIYSGVITIPVSPLNFQPFTNLLCNSEHGILRSEFDGLVPVPKELLPNQCCIFQSEGKTTLAIAKIADDAVRFVHVRKPPTAAMDGIQPRNIRQAFAFALLRDPTIPLVTISGTAGSGKTLLSCAIGMETTQGEDSSHSQILIYRPTIELGKDMGFLPGNIEEKMDPWMRPAEDALKLILQKTKAKTRTVADLMKGGRVSIEPINYLYGRTLQDEWVIVDEAQNTTPHEALEITTRPGERAKMIMVGDVVQASPKLSLDAGSNGLTHVIQRMRGWEGFGHITLEKSERSRLAEEAAKRLS